MTAPSNQLIFLPFTGPAHLEYSLKCKISVGALLSLVIIIVQIFDHDALPGDFRLSSIIQGSHTNHFFI